MKEVYCPYCNAKLEKVPSRKTKCKSCKNYIFVRTDYNNNEKILLKEEQLEEHQKKSDEYFLKNDMKRKMTMGFENKLATGRNIQEILAIELEGSKRTWNWGVYTNIVRRLIYLNYIEDNKLDALKHSIEVLYYEINNPHNRGKYVLENNLQNEYPAFGPLNTKNLNTYTYWFDMIIRLAKELNIENLKNLFIKHNTLKYNELHVIPNKPEVIWEIIKDKF